MDYGPERVHREEHVRGAWNISVNKAQLKNKHEEINHMHLKVLFAMIIEESKEDGIPIRVIGRGIDTESSYRMPI